MFTCICTCVHVYTHIIGQHTFLFSPSDWREETHDVTVRRFVEPVGPAIILPTTVVGIFRLFFTSALVGTIVNETNNYARQVLGDAGSGKWEDVDADDIWAFLGFALLMGINRLPQ